MVVLIKSWVSPPVAFIGLPLIAAVIAIILTTFVAHLDGSGATTFLIVVPAFLPIIKRLGFRKEALLAIICGPYAVMNIVPWGGPTMRAATVAEVETGDLYSFIMPGVIVLAILAFVNGFLVNLNEVRHGLKPESAEEIAAEEAASESSARRHGSAHALVHGPVQRTPDDDPRHGCLLLRPAAHHHRRGGPPSGSRHRPWLPPSC